MLADREQDVPRECRLRAPTSLLQCQYICLPAAAKDCISGDFSDHIERDLAVFARHNGMSLSWQGTGNAPVETSVNFQWILPYIGSLLLTITGSIMSVGYAIKDLPSRIRSTSESAPKTESRESVGVSAE